MMASTFLSFPSVSPSAALSLQDKCKDIMKSGTSFESAFFGKGKQPLYMKTKSSRRITMAVAIKVSCFDNITMAPPDPILGVSEAFKAETSELKLNLGVGAYHTEELQPYVLRVVRKAENLMLERGENKECLLIEGLTTFNKATAELLFGADNPVLHEQRVFQALGPLEQLQEGLLCFFMGVLTTQHALIQLFNNGRKLLEKIADVIQEKNHFQFFDVAYQGFANGSLDEDVSSVRLFAARGMELLVAQSYSKNLGLYAKRVGAINVLCPPPNAPIRVKSQMKRITRPMYSNPPVHGAHIVANVVGNPDFFNEGKEEMEMIAGRIKSVRQKLYNNLSSNDKREKIGHLF